MPDPKKNIIINNNPKPVKNKNESLILNNSSEDIDPNTKNFKNFFYDVNDLETQKKFSNIHYKSKMSCLAGSLNCNTDLVAPYINQKPIRKSIQEKENNLKKYDLASKDLLATDYVPNKGIDAWEFHDFMKQENLGVSVIDKNKPLTYKKNNIFPDGVDYKNLPLGTVIGQGSSKGKYTKEDSDRHAFTIVGFDKTDGTPLVYDYGKIRRIDDFENAPLNDVEKHRIRSITIPKGYEKYNYNYINENIKKQEKKLNIDNTSFTYNSKKPHIQAIEKGVNEVKNELSFNYNISSNIITKFAKILPGLAEQESGINNNTRTTKNLFADNLIGNNVGKPVLKGFNNIGNSLQNLYKEKINNVIDYQKQDYQLEIQAYKKYPNDKNKRDIEFNRLKKIESSKLKKNNDNYDSSVGPFSIKDLPEFAKKQLKINKSDLYGVLNDNETELKNGSKVALTHLTESYVKLQKKYPKLTEDQLIDLSIVAYNNNSKVSDPEFVQKYIIDKKLEDSYLTKIKNFNDFSLGGMLNKYAQGGQLNTTNTNNMLNEFNEGGLHEQNPLGGIPQGMGQNQQMNTVEEGETKKDDFIYSNRIRLTEDIVNQFSLPKTLANKTVAEATKIINNKFEGRNSKIDNSTKKAMLDRIAEAQETIKQIEEAKQAEIAQSMQANSQEVPDMMEGQVPQGMEEFMQPQQQMFDGGSLSTVLGQSGASAGMGQHTGLNQITTAMDLGQTAFGKSGIDTSGAVDANPGAIKPGMMGAQGAMKGAQAGIMFGPVGAAIGGAVGLTAGLVGGNRAKKDALKANQNFEIAQTNKMTSNFAYGGKVNKYFDGGNTNWYNDNPSILNNYQTQSGPGPEGFFKPRRIPEVNSEIKPEINSNTKLNQRPMFIPQSTVDYLKSLQNVPNMQNTIQSAKQSEGVNASMFTDGPQPTGQTNYQRFKNATDKTGNFIGNAANKTGNFINENGANALRYAPAAMNVFQLNQHNKRGYDTVNPMINNTRYNPQYMDERALTNQINAESNYAGNALANASNGSLGMLSNNILASQLNKTRGLSDAYSRVADVNRNENRTGQQFNLNVDEANLARRINAEDMTARNKGAFLTEQSKLRAQIGNDLGNIGKEGVYKKLVKEGFDYTYDGQYVVDSKGKKVIDPDTNEPMTKEKFETKIGKKKDYKAMFSSMNRDFETTLKNK
jgi:hypothetical protein